MIIIHGEDIVASRQSLQFQLDNAKTKQLELIRYDGKKVTLTELKQALEATSLFGQTKMVAVENLLTRTQSKEKQVIIEYLHGAVTQDIILWHDQQLSAAQLKGFPPSVIREFKLPKVLFEFMDGIRPGNSHNNLRMLRASLQQQPDEMLFGMLIKRWRYLIAACEGGTNGLKGFKELQAWQQGRIVSQARNFTLPQLIHIHDQMMKIDFERKTGQTSLSLAQHLELVIGSI